MGSRTASIQSLHRQITLHLALVCWMWSGCDLVVVVNGSCGKGRKECIRPKMWVAITHLPPTHLNQSKSYFAFCTRILLSMVNACLHGRTFYCGYLSLTLPLKTPIYWTSPIEVVQLSSRSFKVLLCVKDMRSLGSGRDIFLWDIPYFRNNFILMVQDF